MEINNQLISVIVPVYNEEKTIGIILKKIQASRIQDGILKEIVVVDDCSADSSLKLINEFVSSNPDCLIRVLHHDKNMGKGACINTALEHINGFITIVQDADLEYDPDEYQALLAPILKGYADVVYGTRFGGGTHRILFFWHSIGNKFLTFFSNAFTNLNLTDMECGSKIFRTEFIKKLKLKEKGFGFEPEITAKISRIPNVRIYEVSISYYGRTYSEGKKVNWKDGIKAILLILKYNLFAKK